MVRQGGSRCRERGEGNLHNAKWGIREEEGPNKEAYLLRPRKWVNNATKVGHNKALNLNYFLKTLFS